MKRLTSKTGKGIAALSVGLLTLVGGVPHANADPKWPNALVGHGSDTTQDVVGALAGEETGVFYTPVTSSVASGAKVLNSWDATGTACVTPRAPGASIQRGNGSTNGRRILSRSIDGALWGSEPACANKSTAGLVDFARSSSGPSGTATDLTYIPFGRDAMSFAYVANGVTPVTELDRAEIIDIMTTADGAVIDGVQIWGCGIQTGSGTYEFWGKALGNINGTPEATGTATCNAAGTGTRVQENDGAGLKAKSDALPGTQVIIGFSAANYISQNNGVVSTQLPAPAGTVKLGSIDVDGPGGNPALGVPYVGTPGSPLTPNATFYADTTFGRDVYNVLASSKLGGLPSANADLKTMFVGSTSAVCTATTTIETFGFKGLGASCGSTTLKGPLVS